MDDVYYSRYFYKGGRLLDAFKKEIEESPEDNSSNTQ
jgi:murein DD-endopeptidase / murein LD-carboxypeptidase